MTREKIAKAGRFIFALCMMAFGIQQLLFGEFLTVFMPVWPPAIPAHQFFTYFFAVLLFIIGLAIMLNVKAVLAALLLGGVSILLLVFVQVPFLVATHPKSLLAYADAFTILAIAGCALIITGTEAWALPGRTGLSIMLITFGIEHFLYTGFVATLVPAWIPGKIFWTYCCGVALIGAGLAILSGIWLRHAVMLLGAMLLLWVILLHIPRAIADPYGGLGGEWSSVFEALAFSGVAFVLAGRDKKDIEDPI